VIRLPAWALALSITASCAFAQWGPEVRLTENGRHSSTSQNSAWNVAADGDAVHVAWFDERDSNQEIYYKRSTDGGATWGPDTRLTTAAGISWYPAIAAASGRVHVTWYEDRDGNWEIYYKRSTDGGETWGPDTRWTNDIYRSANPCIAATGQYVHAVWDDRRMGYPEIYYKRSTDGGATFAADSIFKEMLSPATLPSVAASGTGVHVVWFDTRTPQGDVYYERSADNGVHWSSEQRLTGTGGTSASPVIAAAGANVYTAWQDSRHGSPELYFRRSTDGGASWQSEVRLTTDTVPSLHPSLAVSGPYVHLTWEDSRDGNSEIYYRRSTDAGATWSTDTNLSNMWLNSQAPSVAVGGSRVSVVWMDDRYGNFEIQFRANGSGNPGVEEGRTTDARRAAPAATIVRGVLALPRDESALGHDPKSPGGFRSCPAALLDATGRKVADLAPGASDVRRLAPGVYFVRQEARGMAEAVAKVVLIR
jgi:ethanolamine utilization microcompartment shell protein EutL